MAAWASGPSWLAAAPRASEVCKGCRPWTRWPHCRQRPMWTLNWRCSGCRGISVWYWWADFGLDEAPAAAGAGVGQRRFVGLVDLVGRGRRPMAVRGRGRRRLLRPGVLGLGLGGPLAEGGGLAFAGAADFVQQAGEFLDLPLEIRDSLLEGLTARTVRCVHASIIGIRRFRSCAPERTATREGAKQ